MLRLKDLHPSTRRRVAAELRLARPTMKTQNLSGSLFPEREGAQLQRRAPLRLKHSALTENQSRTEAWHQMAFVSWLRRLSRQLPAAAAMGFHCPNEGALVGRFAEANKRRAMGVRAGVFDWLNLAESNAAGDAINVSPCLMKVRPYSALAIDFKVRERELSEAQRAEFEFLVANGKSAHVAWCWSEAALLHLWYFGLTRDRGLVLSCGSPADYLAPRRGGHDERCPCGRQIVAEVRATLTSA